MAKLTVGFLIGVAFSFAVYLLIGKDSIETSEHPVNQAAVSDHKAKAGRTAAEKGDRSTSSPGVEARAKSISPEPVLDAEPSALHVEDENESISGSNASSQSSVPPTESANRDYPPEIADMIENRVDKDLLARYESDAREESWATYMEGQLAAYFAQKPALAQFYFSLTDCRTSVCSVHALGYGPDALTLWNSATADLVSQPWFEFNSMSMNRRNPQPDVLAIVLILTKKPSD